MRGRVPALELLSSTLVGVSKRWRVAFEVDGVAVVAGLVISAFPNSSHLKGDAFGCFRWLEQVRFELAW